MSSERGRRGPLQGATHALPVVPRHATAAEELPDRPVPRAPSHLATEGKRAWRAVMRSAPLLLPTLDVVAVTRFCEVVDERARLRAELERGVLLEEPIVSPKGDVVGTRVVANPALGELRAIDRQLDQLSDRLGLVPAARARLGLTLTTAERQAAEVDAVLAGRYRKDPK